jgi:hypothetical protein
MAAITDAGGTWNTNAGNKTVTATPASSDLIVVVHGMSGWISGDDSTITDNNSDGLGTYTKIGASPLATGGGSTGAMWVSIRDALVGSASSTIFTATNTGDTGGGLTVFRVSGMTKTGVTAARQNKGESDQTENPPVIDFAGVTLTENPIILGLFAEDNPHGLTVPTDFTVGSSTNWGSPTMGVSIAFINSGKTASNYAWSGGAVTDHSEVGVELDTSAAAAGSSRRRFLPSLGVA